MLRLPSSYELHGYAIVSADECIADHRGDMPDCLRNDADWNYFQGELDLADVQILGRLSHQAAPNPKGRRRIVVSTSANDLEKRDNGHWWNPATKTMASMLKEVLPGGGRIAVPGGRGVFDLCLAAGFTGFHLSRKIDATLPGGVKLFSALETGATITTELAGSGLQPGSVEIIDASAQVSLQVWRRPRRS